MSNATRLLVWEHAGERVISFETVRTGQAILLIGGRVLYAIRVKEGTPAPRKWMRHWPPGRPASIEAPLLA